MFTHTKTIVSGVATAALLATSMLVAMPAAQAAGWNNHGQQSYNNDWRRRNHGNYRGYNRGYNNDDALGAGVFGFVAGAVVGSALANGQHGSDWCEAHYRTYNPATGTFTGYDGRQHVCS